jgi:hypothetical protein
MPAVKPLKIKADGEMSEFAAGDFIPFGSLPTDFQYAESNGDSSTTSATYQNKVTLTTPALTGDYLIYWTVRNYSIADLMKVRCRNTTDSTNVGGELIWKPNDTAERGVLTSFARITFTGAAKSFTIQWAKNVGGGSSATVGEAKITIWKVA